MKSRREGGMKGIGETAESGKEIFRRRTAGRNIHRKKKGPTLPRKKKGERRPEGGEEGRKRPCGVRETATTSTIGQGNLENGNSTNW